MPLLMISLFSSAFYLTVYVYQCGEKIYGLKYNLLKLKHFVHTGVTRNNWLLSFRNGETRILGSVKINSLQMKLNIKVLN